MRNTGLFKSLYHRAAESGHVEFSVVVTWLNFHTAERKHDETEELNRYLKYKQGWKSEAKLQTADIQSEATRVTRTELPETFLSAIRNINLRGLVWENADKKKKALQAFHQNKHTLDDV